MFEMPSLEWIPAWAGIVFPFGVNLMAHSAALILAGLLTARALRGRGAAVESLVLRLTLVAVLLSPAASLTAGWLEWPGLTVPAPDFVRSMVPEAAPEIPGAPAADPVFTPAMTRERDVVLSRGAAAQAGNDGGSATVQSHSESSSMGGMLPALVIGSVVLWAVFSLFLLGRLLVCLLLVGRIRRSAVIADPGTVRNCEELSDIMGVASPTVLQSRLVRSPFLTGVFRPAVLLPETGAATEPVGREVLLHELAHLVRRDCFWNLLAQGAVALLSLQPLMRVLTRRIEDVSDDVCDDYVVDCGANPQAYARQLFAVAEQFRPSTPELLIGVGIVTFKSSLGRRIERILDSSREFVVRPGTATVVRVAGFCAVLTLLVGLTGVRGRPIAEAPIIVPPLVMPVEQVLLPRPTPAKVTPPAPSAEKEPAPSAAGAFGTGPGMTPETDSAPEHVSINHSAEQASNIIVGESAPAAPGTALPQTGSPAEYDAKLSDSVPSVPAEEKSALSDGREHETSGPPVRVAMLERAESPTVRPDPVTNAGEPAPAVEYKDVKSALLAAERAVESGKYAEAEAALVAAMAKSPRDPEIMNRLGRVYYLKRDYGKAAACLRTAIARQSNFADAHYNMGDVLLAQGDLEAAMVEYKAAIQFNSAYARRTRALF